MDLSNLSDIARQSIVVALSAEIGVLHQKVLATQVWEGMPAPIKDEANRMRPRYTKAITELSAIVNAAKE